MSKAKTQVKSFSVGDQVSWESQAGGHTKKKTGTVIEVVPAFKIPRDKNFGSNRKHESYIVEVTYEPKRSTSAIKSVRVKKPERYWPVVANLRLVKRGNWAGRISPADARPHPTGVTDPVPAEAADPGGHEDAAYQQHTDFDDASTVESVN